MAIQYFIQLSKKPSRLALFHTVYQMMTFSDVLGKLFIWTPCELLQILKNNT